MPPLSESERTVPLPPLARTLAHHGGSVLVSLWRAMTMRGGAGVSKTAALGQFTISLVPALFIAVVLGLSYRAATAPVIEASTAGLVEAGGLIAAPEQSTSESSTGLSVPPEAGESGLQEPPSEAPKELGVPPGTQEPNAERAKEPSAAAEDRPAGEAPATADAERQPAPTWFWIMLAIGLGIILLVYWLWNWERLEVFKLLLSSFFPLALLIIAVLGSIVFGLATPAEAAAVGAFGGFLMAMAYRYIAHLRNGTGGPFSGAVIGGTMREFGTIIKESSFLTAKTSAMVCWLFVGSGIFSAAFALLGGQEVIEKWVLSMDLTPVQFMILAQFIIFILGWPLEWTEIIIIFMPIFIPLLPHFQIDPLFFGLLVALNLQTAFLSPPVAMAAFYLKGVSPPHVTLNQIFAGMMPFMAIQVIALILLYVFPQIGLWLPHTLYK
jgi:TRAP-type mannitol/chloroaromatic compound transport system permease large subunit